MTVGEFKSKFAESKYDDLEISVHKSDKFQLTCSTTVPIDSARRGFDWTSGQVVLEPKFELSTSQSVLDENLVKRAREESAENTRLLKILAQISMIASNMVDSESKNAIREELKKVSRHD